LSQIYKSLAAGPVPPTVATSYVTDVNSPAVPAANVLNVPGGSVITNNDHGIQTDGSSGSNTLTVELTNRVSLTTTTVGAVTNVINVLTPTAGTSVTFTLTLTAYDTADNIALGGEQIGLGRALGGVAAVIGTNDTFDEYDAALGTNDWEIVANGASLALSVTGVAGKTLNWKAVFTYIQAP
jgi:hypothetical protein